MLNNRSNKESVLAFLLVLFFLKAADGYGQTMDTATKENVLNEFVLSARKSERLLKDVSQSVLKISEATIQSTNAQTTADLLAVQGNVAVQKSQQGGGSPIVWGFEANRVLLVIDGVRMNNLIYRGGHLQNVISIDQFMLNGVEVLHGPSSVHYGSDALGGVLHFYTRNPKPSGEKNTIAIVPSFAARYGTVNKERTFHGALHIAGGKWASYLAATQSTYGDLRMGKKVNPAVDSFYFLRKFEVKTFDEKDSMVPTTNAFIQAPSGYKQFDIISKTVLETKRNFKHTINLQSSQSTDVPRFDRLTNVANIGNLQVAEWYYGPQVRRMISYQFDAKNFLKADLLQAIISYQKVKESRHDRRFNSPFLNHRYEEVDVLSYTILRENQFGKHQLQVGYDGQINFLKSTAEREHIYTGQFSGLDTRYPDGGSYMNSQAIFANDDLSLSKKTTLGLGVRLGYSSLKAKLQDSLVNLIRVPDVAQQFLVYSGHVGIAFLPSSFQKLHAGISMGYRAPNVDDLSKIFESNPGTIILPNEKLKPEQTLTSYMGYSYSRDRIWFTTTAYYTRLFNGIITQKSSYNGADSFYKDGIGYQVYRNQNVRQSFITGIDFNTKIRVISKVYVLAMAQYTYGRIVGNQNMPLDHIPPFSGKVGMLFSEKNITAELFALHNAWKKIANYNLEGEDNQQYALASGMPSWTTVNLKGTYVLNKFFFQAGMENIFDIQYRTAFSGINAAGRNLYLAVKYNL